MNVSPLQTGMLLALLELQRNGKVISVDLSDAEQAVLHNLEEGFAFLADQSDTVSLKSLLDGITCSEVPCLRRKSELLAMMFLIDSSTDGEATEQNRQDFFRMMNSCYTCFQEFSDIMRGYYQIIDAHAEQQNAK
ncbi:MAG: hypothetical protein ACRBF0_11780 [Calditrichia bacterium]